MVGAAGVSWPPPLRPSCEPAQPRLEELCRLRSTSGVLKGYPVLTRLRGLRSRDEAQRLRNHCRVHWRTSLSGSLASWCTHLPRRGAERLQARTSRLTQPRGTSCSRFGSQRFFVQRTIRAISQSASRFSVATFGACAWSRCSRQSRQARRLPRLQKKSPTLSGASHHRATGTPANAAIRGLVPARPPGRSALV